MDGEDDPETDQKKKETEEKRILEEKEKKKHANCPSPPHSLTFEDSLLLVTFCS